MFLNPKQLESLTGYKRPSAQKRAMRLMKIRYWQRPDGRLVVPESALRDQDRDSAEINFEAIT